MTILSVCYVFEKAPLTKNYLKLEMLHGGKKSTRNENTGSMQNKCAKFLKVYPKE